MSLTVLLLHLPGTSSIRLASLVPPNNWLLLVRNLYEIVQVDSSLSRQKKDAESIWKAQAWQPISALQGVGKVFEPYRDSKVDLLGPKLLFIALNLGGLALKFWKLNTLGLLPTHASDWVSSLSPAPEVEYSGGDILLHSY